MPPCISGVYLPCSRAEGQQLGMWFVVGLGELHRVHLFSAVILHLLRLMDEGRKSQPARNRKDSWPTIF